MANPTINLARLFAKGNSIDIKGVVDLQGVTGTVMFYLDPRPSGTPLGPFPLTLDGLNIVKNLRLGAGKWRARVVVTPDEGPMVSEVSPDLTVNRCRCVVNLRLPDGGTSPAPAQQTVVLDPQTQAIYSAAIAAAASGSKRMAGALAMAEVFGDKQVLEIFHNGRKLVRCEYVGPMTISNSAGETTLNTSLPTPAIITSSAILTSGIATFTLQGGENYTAEMRGSVGLVGSGKAIILSSNPIAGYALESAFDFLLPVETETL